MCSKFEILFESDGSWLMAHNELSDSHEFMTHEKLFTDEQNYIIELNGLINNRITLAIRNGNLMFEILTI